MRSCHVRAFRPAVVTAGDEKLEVHRDGTVYLRRGKTVVRVKNEEVIRAARLALLRHRMEQAERVAALTAPPAAGS